MPAARGGRRADRAAQVRGAGVPSIKDPDPQPLLVVVDKEDGRSEGPGLYVLPLLHATTGLLVAEVVGRTELEAHQRANAIAAALEAAEAGKAVGGPNGPP